MRMDRRELKEDQLANILVRIGEWVNSHREAAGAIGVTLAVSLILGVYFFTHYFGLQQRAWDRLNIAEGLYYDGKKDEAFKIFNELSSRYRKSKVYPFGLLTEGQLKFREGDYSAAEKIFQQLRQERRGRKLLPFALLGLAASYENMNRLEEAEKVYKEFVDGNPEHFLAPKAFEGLGRVYELKGDMEKAKAAYEKIIILFAGSSWAKRAEKDKQRLETGMASPSAEKPQNSLTLPQPGK